MSLRTYIVEKMFGAEIDKRVTERLPAASAGAGNEIQWRRLTGNSPRELPLATWQRQVEVVYWLWKTNPLGNWIIETLTAFVAGKGFTYTAKNEDVKQTLDDFWFDPVNRLDLNLESMVRELKLFGVQCWPVFVAEQTGRVRLGMLDPQQIVEVYTDPENAKMIIGVKVQDFQQFSTGTKTRLLKVIITGEAETVLSETARAARETFTDGQCFYFSINRVSNDPYGTSDLFAIADWLDEYEEFVFNYSRKARKQNAYIWDVKLTGATEEECKRFATDNANPPDGALRVHNEKAEWDAVAPTLQAMELKDAAGVFRNHILGNKSIPEHWYGGGGDVNRNTASESNEPIQAFIDSRQNLVKFILETMFTFVIQSAVDARYLTGVQEEELFDFAVNKPETSNRDLTKIGAAVQSIVTAMVAAASQSWLDQETAVKLFAHLVALIGFEIDPENVLDAEPGSEDYENGRKAPVIPGEPAEAPVVPEKG